MLKKESAYCVKKSEYLGALQRRHSTGFGIKLGDLVIRLYKEKFSELLQSPNDSHEVSRPNKAYC